MNLNLRPFTRSCVMIYATDTQVGMIKLEDGEWRIYLRFGMNVAELKQLLVWIKKFNSAGAKFNVNSIQVQRKIA